MRQLSLPITTIGIILAASSIMTNLFGDEGSAIPGPYDRLTVAFGGPLVLPIGLLMMAGGLMFMFGLGGSSLSAGENAAAPRPIPPQPKRLQMTERATAASRNVDALLARFRAMPATIVTDEARVEFDAIAGKHLPELRAAHAEARGTVPYDSADAQTLDAELAVSLDRIAGSLEELIDACEDAGRSRLAVESRFIELRHPQAKGGEI